MSAVTDDVHAIDVDCPVCSVPAHLEVRTTITLPDDVEAIITAMVGRANVIHCAVCDTDSRGPTAVRLVADGATLAESNDPATLRRFALAWANTYMMRATARLMDEIDGRAEPVRDDHGVPLLDTPIALALLHEQAEGRLAGHVVTDPPQSAEWQQEFIARFALGRVLDRLGHLYKEAFHGPGISAFPALVEARIPPACLTPAVLEELAGRCEGWAPELMEPSRSDEFSRRLRHELVCAAAHAVAGVENPRGAA